MSTSRVIPSQFMVVSKALALQMSGKTKIVKSKRGSVYGVFNSLESAERYMETSGINGDGKGAHLYMAIVECP